MKKEMLRSLVVAGPCFFLAAQFVFAEERTQGIEEVIVTAEYRESTVQDTAIAISAFAQEALDLRQIDTTSDLQFSVPNLVFSKDNFSGSNATIRGISNGVAVHINRQYIVAPKLYETEFHDVERIEVLRGPQGTLYGRNTTGGIINIITKKPEDELGAKVEVSFGNYGSQKIDGAVNVPLGDSAGTRFAFYWLKRDGYTDNLYTGNDIDDRDLYSLRWTTDVEFKDNTNVSLMLSLFEEDDGRARVTKQVCTKDMRGVYGQGCEIGSKGFETPHDQATIQQPLIGIINANAAYNRAKGRPALPTYGPTPSTDSGAYTSFAYGLRAGLGAAGLPAALLDDYAANAFDSTATPYDGLAGAINPADMRKVYADFDPEYYSRLLIATLTINHQLENMSIEFIGSYSTNENVQLTDYDWAVPTTDYITPVTYYVNGRERTVNFSEIVDNAYGDRTQKGAQLTVISDFSGALNFTVGAMYIDYESDTGYIVHAASLAAYAQQGGYMSIVSTLTGTPNPPALDPYYWDYHSNTLWGLETWAVFSELYYDVTDQLRFTLGLRYTDESIHAQRLLTMVDLLSTPRDNRFGDWDQVTGKIGIDYQLSGDTLLYATVARGFKSGTFNQPPKVENMWPDMVDPELADTYEFGLKTRMLEGRLQANLAVFFNAYTDMQIGKIIDQSVITMNTDADIKGLEAELMFAPGDRWLLSLNLAFLDTDIKRFSSFDAADPTQGDDLINIFGDMYDYPAFTIARSEVSLDGNNLALSPNMSVNAFVDYTYPMSNGMSLVLHLDWFYQDDYYSRFYNTPADKVDSWGVSNGAVTLIDEANNWQLRFWVKNLPNDDNITGHYITDSYSGLFTNEFVLDPRTYGLSFSKSF